MTARIKLTEKNTIDIKAFPYKLLSEMEVKYFQITKLNIAKFLTFSGIPKHKYIGMDNMNDIINKTGLKKDYAFIYEHGERHMSDIFISKRNEEFLYYDLMILSDFNDILGKSFAEQKKKSNKATIDFMNIVSNKLFINSDIVLYSIITSENDYDFFFTLYRSFKNVYIIRAKYSIIYLPVFFIVCIGLEQKDHLKNINISPQWFKSMINKFVIDSLGKE